VAAVLFLTGDYRQERAFRKESEKILSQLSQGKIEQVYEEASSRFQQTLLVDKFQDLVDRMNATMGHFVRVSDVIAVDPAASVAGMTAYVGLELEFEQATTRGHLSFHRGKDGQWRLLGLGVTIPDELEAKAAALEAQAARLQAPKEVIDLVRAILQGVREGRAAEVHEGASPAYKGIVSIDSFKAMLQSHQAELGNFVKIVAVISSARSPDRARARVQALLEYEKTKTTGTFEFMRIGTDWRLLDFKIIIPFGDTTPTEKPL
jgi:hypothetical protein